MKVDNKLLMIFQYEVKKQCEFAISAAVHLNDCLQNLDNQNTSQIFWYHTQSFLIATANISKLLWGNAETFESREALRDSLQIKECSPLRSRKLRNHFEHFDERIESWAKSSERMNFADSNIGPSNMIIGLDQKDFLRNFDTENIAFTFRGETFEIQPIIDELQQLLKVARDVTNPHND